MANTLYTLLAQSSGGQNLLIAAVLAFAAYMVYMSFFGRKEKKQYEQMLANLKKNDRIVTIGGIMGSVVSVTPQEVVVKVDESANVKITFIRSAIQRVLTESPKGPEGS